MRVFWKVELSDGKARAGRGGEVLGRRALKEPRGQGAARVTVCVDGDVIQKDRRGHRVEEGCKSEAKVFDK